jgi:hypothetical protein
MAAEGAGLGSDEKPVTWSFINMPSSVGAGASTTARPFSKATFTAFSHLRGSLFSSLVPVDRLSIPLSRNFVFLHLLIRSVELLVEPE